MSRIDQIAGLEMLDEPARAQLAGLNIAKVPPGKVLFRPGDNVAHFVLVLAGEIEIYLMGASGREILLYSVVPGETCVQTTLGLMGEQDYSSEAVAASEVEMLLIPKPMFMELLGSSEAFRLFVFQAFAGRLQSMMQVLEKVAFIKVEDRLAGVLLERSDENNLVHNTHQELAVAIGSVREVVSRRLELFAKRGLVRLERGAIQITSKAGLVRLIS